MKYSEIVVFIFKNSWLMGEVPRTGKANIALAVC